MESDENKKINHYTVIRREKKGRMQIWIMHNTLNKAA